IVRKLTAGQVDRIRPCVGATYCSTYRQCIHNAATGREATLPHDIAPAPVPRRAVVVGGGPAGMEAARVLAHRGHRVTLFEAAEKLGGQILLAARASWRKDLIGITDWLSGELAALGVDVRLGEFAGAEEIAALPPDITILATGGVPDTDWVAGDAEVLSTWDMLSATEPPKGEVLIMDASGRSPGISCADWLSGLRVKVELVTPERMVGHQTGKIEAPIYLSHLYENGVSFTTDHTATVVEKYNGRIRVELVNVLTGAVQDRVVDHVVVERGTVPNDELWRELAPTSINEGVTDPDALALGRPQPHADASGQLYRIGDAVASRDIHAAIFDALRLVKDL
ncbi:MAG: FAD-dependent oxidoreductase, partial [Pseudomonadota bacterium]